VFSLSSKQATVGQGVAMGLSNSFMSLGRIVGPIWAGFAFDMNFSASPIPTPTLPSVEQNP
jgi:hypothetical protein